jgi:hypothetical protein
MSQSGSTPGAAEVSSALLARWQAHVRAGIEQMQAAGEVRRSLDPGIGILDLQVHFSLLSMAA